MLNMKNYFMAILLVLICGTSLFAAGQISANWAAADALGRKLPTNADVGDVKKDKYVAMFYWTWHVARHAQGGYVNNEQTIKEHPDAVNDYDNPIWSKLPQPGGYHWSEPLFGYYRTTDPWVLRKHAEMLSDAGVDVVIFDATNAPFTWKESYDVLASVWLDARKDGVNTPQIAFLCPFAANESSLAMVQELYNDIYQSGRFKELWFNWNGKPLIMAYPDNIPEPMRSFFTFRPGQPGYRCGPQRKDDWSWLEVYPQHGYVEYEQGKYEMVGVGVAQNATDAIVPAAMNSKDQVYGRSYTKGKGFNTRPDASLYGLNFQQQWRRAFELDPKLVFVTGWNEWIAGRFENWQGTENAFPDQFNMEYSRDIEPTKAAIADNYYYQLVSNIRRFKGVENVPAASGAKEIVIDGDFSDWKDVLPDYLDHKGDTMHRDHPGYGALVYVNDTGRNDIVRAKVSFDVGSLYFLIETAADITDQKDNNWMMLLIDADRDKQTGWQGYDYIINRISPQNGKAAVEKNLYSEWNWNRVADAQFVVAGGRMELRIPRLTMFDKPQEKIDIEFKWADNIKADGDIMDFYISGDVAPSGRFNYVYTVK